MTNLSELNAELARSSDAVARNGGVPDDQRFIHGALVGATLARAGWVLTQPHWYENQQYPTLNLTTDSGVIRAFDFSQQDPNGDAQQLTVVPFSLTAR